MFWLAFTLLSCTWLILRFLGRVLYVRIVAKNTALNELAELGTPRAGSKIRGTAVICGGSISGLFTARVCADHFEDVLIVEPEAWLPTDDGRAARFDANGDPVPQSKKLKRSRVAQYDAVHGYLAYSMLALRKLFPNWDIELKKGDVRISEAFFPFTASGVAPPRPVSTSFRRFSALPDIHCASREAYETVLRRLTLEEYKSVRWVVGSVVGVRRAEDDSGRIGVVEIRSAGGDGVEVLQEAALVVDCTGASQSGVKWLEAAGYGSPSPTDTSLPSSLTHLRTSYTHKMRYTCFVIPIPRNAELREKLSTLIPGGYEKCGGLLYGFFPDFAVEKRSLAIARIEGHRLHIVCGGWSISDRERPRTISEIKACIRSYTAVKPVPEWVFEVIDLVSQDLDQDDEDAIECTDVKVRPSTYVRYHKCDDLPSNFVAIGDSSMVVNPIFAQGCTKACLSAVVLNSHLLRVPREASSDDKMQSKDVLPQNFSKSFFASLAPKMSPMWDGPRFLDYQMKTTIPVAGETLQTGAFQQWYGGRVMRASFKDATVNSAAWHVNNCLAPGEDMLHPEIVARVLWVWAIELFFASATNPKSG